MQDALGCLKQVIAPLLAGNRKATKYLSPKLVVKASRRHKPRYGALVEIVLTIGRPNYAEQEFIADAKKAGEGFPVRKIQVKAWE